MSRFMKFALPLLAVLLVVAVVSARRRAAARPTDPWERMLALQKDMDALVEEQSRLGFVPPSVLAGAGQSAAAEVRVERGPNETAVVFKVPGLNAQSLKVDVTSKGIALSCERRDLREIRDARGRVTSRSESYQSVRQSVPIPRGVDPATSRIEPKPDEVRVIFQAAPDPRLRS